MAEITPVAAAGLTTEPPKPVFMRPKSGHPSAPKITECPTLTEGTRYLVIIETQIGDTEAYVELLYLLNNAKDNDIVHIKIRTPGGSILTGMTIINAMLTTKAFLITEATGECASMGTGIWAAGDEIRMGRWGSVMFHSASHGDNGKSLSIMENAANVISFFNFYNDDIAVKRGLLTEEEHLRLSTDKIDMFLDYDTMAPRLASLKHSSEWRRG